MNESLHTASFDRLGTYEDIILDLSSKEGGNSSFFATQKFQIILLVEVTKLLVASNRGIDPIFVIVIIILSDRLRFQSKNMNLKKSM